MLIFFIAFLFVITFFTCFSYSGNVVFQLQDFDIQMDFDKFCIFLASVVGFLLFLYSFLSKLFSLSKSFYNRWQYFWIDQKKKNFLKGMQLCQYELYKESVKCLKEVGFLDDLALFFQASALEQLGQNQDAIKVLLPNLNKNEKEFSLLGLIKLEKNYDQKLFYLKQAYVFFPKSPLVHRFLYITQWFIFKNKDDLEDFIDFSQDVERQQRNFYKSKINWLFVQNAKFRNLDFLEFLYNSWYYDQSNLYIALELIKTYRDMDMIKKALKIAYKSLKVNPNPALVNIILELDNIKGVVAIFNHAYELSKNYIQNEAFLFYLSVLAARADLLNISKEYSERIVHNHYYRNQIRSIIENHKYADSVQPFELSWQCKHCGSTFLKWEPVCESCHGLLD